MDKRISLYMLLFILLEIIFGCHKEDIAMVKPTAGVYYVAPDGSDGNPGTISKPWKTWGKALSSRAPGDVVYFRGGVYYMTVLNGLGYRANVIGTATDSIFLLNYPGERPILDCSTVTSTTLSHQNLALGTDLYYVHARGLTIRNVWQLAPTDEARVWNIGGAHSVIENCTCYNSHGRGFWPDGADELLLLNCDSYNHVDVHTTALPGNDGYGYFVEDEKSTTHRVYIRNCRAWRCGDDGFTCYSTSYVEFDHCWSFYNGALEGEGHGFKLGWQIKQTNTLRRLVKNCIATWNFGQGFTTNDRNLLTSLMEVYNNTSYHNLHQPYFRYNSEGFVIYNTSASDAQELGRVFKNNLSYNDIGGPVYVGPGALYTHSNNIWDLPVTVKASDFVSLDTTGLTAPRIGENGLLPDMRGFLELAAGSDLIDKGTDVGLPYSGAAPDLGAYERK
jgi:hypothetical protein